MSADASVEARTRESAAGASPARPPIPADAARPARTIPDGALAAAAAAAEVARAIRALEYRAPDAIAIVRGGGAKMDLVAFDDIAICRAIANCACPVITGIGHEIDLSVADLVAFRHFVTPTDVARFLVAQMDDLWGRIDKAGEALEPSCRQNLSRARVRLHRSASELAYLTQRHTTLGVGALYKLAHAFTSHTLRRLSQGQADISRLRQGLINASGYALQSQAERFTRQRAGLAETIREALRQHAGRLDELEAYLVLMDPSATLKRGYSITLDENGQALTDARTICIGKRITTILSQGRIMSLVQDKEQV